MKAFPRILNENKYFVFLYNIPLYLRIVITALICVSLTILWLGFFYVRTKKASVKYVGELKSLQVKIDKFSKISVNQEMVLHEKNKQSDFLCNICLGKDKGNKDGFYVLLGLIKSNNLSCMKINPKGTKNSKFYEKENYKLLLSGAFVDVFSFFKRLEKMKPLVNLKTFNIERGKKNKVLVDADIQVIKKVYK